MGNSNPSALALIAVHNYIRRMLYVTEQVTRRVCFSAWLLEELIECWDGVNIDMHNCSPSWAKPASWLSSPASWGNRSLWVRCDASSRNKFVVLLSHPREEPYFSSNIFIDREQMAFWSSGWLYTHYMYLNWRVFNNLFLLCSNTLIILSGLHSVVWTEDQPYFYRSHLHKAKESLGNDLEID